MSAVKIHTTSTTKTKQISYGEKTKIEKWRRSAGRKNNKVEDKTENNKSEDKDEKKFKSKKGKNRGVRD